MGRHANAKAVHHQHEAQGNLPACSRRADQVPQCLMVSLSTAQVDGLAGVHAKRVHAGAPPECL